MEQIYTTHSVEETRALGARLAQQLKPGLVTLSGDLGAGKTALSAGILEGLGAQGPYTSPTFVLMKEYELSKGGNGIERVYHADAYRVEAKDFVALGFTGWTEDEEALTLLEWPEKVADLLPKNSTRIQIESINETERKIRIEE
jgi:tRNA threonylcarbamoyladenosine biosynthesis protein TsaE